MIRFRVDGIEDAIERLKKQSNPKALDRAMHHLMIQARNKSKNHYCPVKTGQLRDSIYIRRIRFAEYEIGATMYYAIWHEFGSYNINVGTVESPNLIKSGYSPFIRPAVWDVIKNFPEWVNQYIREL